MSWWDADEEARILRARVARLEREIAELGRRHPTPTTNVIPFPNGEEYQLPSVADGTVMELGNQREFMRKTNGNGS